MNKKKLMDERIREATEKRRSAQAKIDAILAGDLQGPERVKALMRAQLELELYSSVVNGEADEVYDRLVDQFTQHRPPTTNT